MTVSKSTKSYSALEYPLVLVGFDSTVLQGEALVIEKKKNFKKLLIKHVETKIGKININWKSEDVVELLGGDLDAGEAWSFLNRFLDSGPGKDNMSIDYSVSSCRATPTGWVREWRFVMQLNDGGGRWTSEQVLEDYYREHRYGQEISVDLRNEFRRLSIDLIVVDKFDID